MTPKKDPEFHRPATPGAPRKPALTLQKLKEQVDRMDAEPMLPDPPDQAFWHWVAVATFVFALVLTALVFAGQRESEKGIASLEERWAHQQAALNEQAAAIAQLRESESLKSDRAAILKFDGNNITVSQSTIADVALDLDARCWAQVTDGAGKMLRSEFLPAGRSNIIHAQLPVTVRDGCPGHVSFTVDGQPVDPPREPGHAQNRVEVVTLGGPGVKPQSYIYAVPEERWRPCTGRCA